MLAEANGMPVVAHVHDEIICEVPDDGSKTVEMLADCMKTVPTWATGLPLDAAGFSSKYYRKD
jgi:DNA polymerase